MLVELSELDAVCDAVAAAVLGDADAVKYVPLTAAGVLLLYQLVKLMYYHVTQHTLLQEMQH